MTLYTKSRYSFDHTIFIWFIYVERKGKTKMREKFLRNHVYLKLFIFASLVYKSDLRAPAGEDN